MGWFFRSLHHWGAQLAILVLFIHVFATLLLKSYRKPRELLWVSGFFLLAISIFFGLSGYFLLWDERAFAAVRVATGGAGNLPLVGGFIKAFFRGGMDVTGETLTRFYAFHVSVLPLLTLAPRGHPPPPRPVPRHERPPVQQGQRPRGPFFPNMLYRDFMIWLVVLGVVVTLATLLPPGIGKQGGPPRASPENIKPEWYFLFLFQTLKLFPGTLRHERRDDSHHLRHPRYPFLLPSPFLRQEIEPGQRSPLFTAIGVAYLVYFVVMTIVGYLT